MFIRVGNYTHPPNEVNLTNFEARRRFSERGDPTTVVYRMELVGEIIATGQAAIAARIAEVIDAYAQINPTIGLYHDDGTPTRHILPADSPDNLTGNQIEFHRWPKGEAEEYATQRTFHVVATAEFRIGGASQLLAWEEKVRILGNGGPLVEWQHHFLGPPTPQVVYHQTIQQIVQEGFADGLDGWPMGHVPPPLFPLFEQQHLRQSDRHSPLNRGRQFSHYRVTWRYVMTIPLPVDVFPNIEYPRLVIPVIVGP